MGLSSAFGIERADGGMPVCFRCRGELDLAGAPQVREALEPIDADVLLDVRDLSFIDSSGVGVLVAEQTRLLEHGYTLRLLGLQPAPKRALEILGLLDDLT